MYCTVASDTIEGSSRARGGGSSESANYFMSVPLNIIPLAENFRGARAPCAPVVLPPMLTIDDVDKVRYSRTTCEKPL